ncbi:ARID DNA-binding domain-containing protein [Tanacetum coccineum]
MVFSNYFLERNWTKGVPSRSRVEHWHQSKKPGRQPRMFSQIEFLQRQLKRERENRIGHCARHITNESKNMLRKQIEDIKIFNSSLPHNKFKQYVCFYCNGKGHIVKNCPIKPKAEPLFLRRKTAGAERDSKHAYEETKARIKMNKDMVVCFKCHKRGHFANKCPQDTKAIPNLEKPTVSVKYPEFIYFKTRGILKGTDMIRGMDFCYKRYLFITYGIGEVLILNEDRNYLIPGVQYAPEITLNILSLSLLKQQGFDTIFEGDRCILAYMFKNYHGKNINLDKMKQRHNDYLDDYFESLDRDMNINRRIEPIRKETKDDGEVHNFQECVAFLNLIKKDNGTSKEWDDHRDKFNKVLKWFFNHYLNRSLPGMLPPTIKGVTIHLFDLYKLTECMGGFLHVQFSQEFGALAEILGLSRSDGEEIQRCYIDYLEVLVSFYKTARSSRDPMRGNEDLECFKDYRRDGNMDDTMAAKKGKGQVEHFGIYP